MYNNNLHGVAQKKNIRACGDLKLSILLPCMFSLKQLSSESLTSYLLYRFEELYELRNTYPEHSCTDEAFLLVAAYICGAHCSSFMLDTDGLRTLINTVYGVRK
jgi:hypothetical protein